MKVKVFQNIVFRLCNWRDLFSHFSVIPHSHCPQYRHKRLGMTCGVTEVTGMETYYIYIYTNPHCSLRSFSAPLELSAKWNRLLHPMTKTTKVQCHGEVGGWTKGCIRQPCVWRVYHWKPTGYTLTHTAACALFQLPWSYLQDETASSIQWQKPLRSNVTHHPCAPLWQSRVEAA